MFSSAFKRTLWWMIAGTRGGVTRGKIILALKERPLNANQLAELLQLHYRAIRFHLELLVDNNILTNAGGKYGAVYFLSPEIESNWELFKEIWNRLQRIDKKKG
ncbi:winged helix-turn-helix domain-containing protein [Candidatus Hecatella orcuttiae]|uniref:winged helix-turn-helix domain-containing protein n=1 Tax=Candidatus Hecatella orcuttiae TaxID=1935119 RepID=UPI002868309D|nr:winged helix-turn-helix domain-containing protein [Candidatus Hecatella orcuttiae]